MPNWIAKYNNKVLENKFKVADTILQNTLLQVKEELSLEGFSSKDIKNLCPAGDCANNGTSTLINTYFVSVLEAKGAKCRNLPYEFTKAKRYLYKGAQGASYWFQFPGSFNSGIDVNICALPNGIVISPMSMQLHGSSDGIKIGIDINGLKGPNTEGYDIFIYNTGGWSYDFSSNPCRAGQNVSQSYELYGCYHYARINESPTDSTKGYWENLN